MELFEKPQGVQTRWFSFENSGSGRAHAGLENAGAKGHAFDHLPAGETVTLAAVEGSGTLCRIWITVNDRSPEMLRSLRLEMFWDGSAQPAVSVPLGDFFGIAHGRRTPFENALFSDPEGRSFNCCIPMPFRSGARITLTNDSEKRLSHLFYDVDILLNVAHSPETLYFHALWRRESPNALGKDFTILPRVSGAGRFLGCNLGVIAHPGYKGSWWGEGEVKVRFGDDENPTLCGTGTEDYIGTGWGQGAYGHRTQGCLIADRENRQWAFYRYHIDDPIYFDDGCDVTIQTIGGSGKSHVIEMKKADMEIHYRSVPHFQTHIAVSARLKGTPCPKEEIGEKLKTYSNKRWTSQPAAPSAGCIFKNPGPIPAGKLIDELGLKNLSVGSARVSEVHGNFIVNDGGTTAEDVLQLIALIQSRARESRQIDLTTEVSVLGEEN